MATAKEPMDGVREYNEEMTPDLEVQEENGRFVVLAYNEGGFNSTRVDLLDLIRWTHEHHPELLKLLKE